MKDSDKLLRAAELVERGWCQGASAMDSRGNQVAPDDPMATRWCTAGACWAVGTISAIKVVLDVVHWNDAPERTQDDAICALHAAAMLAMSEER